MMRPSKLIVEILLVLVFVSKQGAAQEIATPNKPKTPKEDLEQIDRPVKKKVPPLRKQETQEQPKTKATKEYMPGEKLPVKHKEAQFIPKENALPVKHKSPAAISTKNIITPKYKTIAPVHSKELVMEFPCNPNATVIFKNFMRKVDVFTSTDNKVKLVTTVYYQGQPSLTDNEWQTKAQLNISGSATNVEVQNGFFPIENNPRKLPYQSSPDRPDTIFNGIAVFDSTGRMINLRSSSEPNTILYVPANVKLEIQSKYSDMALRSDFKEVKAEITHGSLSLMDADQLSATTVYGRFYAGNVKQATLDFTNAKLSARNIGTLDIASKNSSIYLNTVQFAKLNSQADQFEIDEAKTLTGKKNYGGLRLTKLKGSVDISGLNADINIRQIEPSATAIKIATQYADLRLPVAGLSNYSVAFEGSGGTVNAPFNKTVLSDASFTASVGNVKPRTDFKLTCQNCSVDFK